MSVRRTISACSLVLTLAGIAPTQQPIEAAHDRDRVVLFTSLRESAVREVVADFERQTGLGVVVQRVPRRTGVFTRELVERFAAARGDVFWCQETMTTDALRRAGALQRMDPPPGNAAGIDAQFHADDGSWFGFGGRARILMVNTELLPVGERPQSMWHLLDPRLRGKVGFARPSAGTSLFHLLALRSAIGADETDRWLDGLQRNEAVLAAGDGDLAAMIGEGVVACGMTDTSDFRGVAAQGRPVAAIVPDQDGTGALIVPHTVAMLQSAGNVAGARRLIDYLLSAAVEQALVAQQRGQMALRPGVPQPAGTPTLGEVKRMRASLALPADEADTVGAALIDRFARRVVDFETMRKNRPPVGMTVAQAGDGARGVWLVVDDPSSPDHGRVVRQVDTTDLGGRFPLCVSDDRVMADVSVQACFRADTGDSDRAAGLCVRLVDERNYYCCRVNSLEDNYRFYKVVDGRRIELGGVDRMLIPEGEWHSMRLDAKGQTFTMWYDGVPLFTVEDATFTRPGKVGLWLKGDSITSFDLLTITPAARTHRHDFEDAVVGTAPARLDALATNEHQVEWQVVVPDAAIGGGRSVTPVIGEDQGEVRRRGGALLLDEATIAGDVSVATRFRVATEGPGMHLAGLVARYRSQDEHYYVRINLEESNLRLYRFHEGKRQILGERHHFRIDDHAWHDVRLTAVGGRLELSIDGGLQFAAWDDDPLAEGKAGVWAAPGGNTLFDEISVTSFD